MRKKNGKGGGGGGWGQKRFLFSSHSFVNPYFRSRYNFFNKNARKRLLLRLDATLHRNRCSSQRWVKRMGRYSRAFEQFIPWKFGSCANVVSNNQNSWKKVNSNYQSEITLVFVSNMWHTLFIEMNSFLGRLLCLESFSAVSTFWVVTPWEYFLILLV